MFSDADSRNRSGSLFHRSGPANPKMAWTHGKNESREITENIWDNEKIRLLKTKKTTDKMGRLCEERYYIGKARWEEKWRESVSKGAIETSSRTAKWQLTRLTSTKGNREEEE